MSETAETEPSTQRIEAFSDGVFAIAITLLILEIKVPHAPAGAEFSLARELRHLWPDYFAHVLSFLVIGIYWANHHYVFRLYQRTDHLFNLLNVLFLMCISFLPLPTAVLGAYALDPVNGRTAGTFYALGLLMPAMAWALMWLYASGNERLIDRRLEPAFVRRLTRQYLLSLGLYSLALLASLSSLVLGLTVSVGLTVLYLMAPMRPVYRGAGSRPGWTRATGTSRNGRSDASPDGSPPPSP